MLILLAIIVIAVIILKLMRKSSNQKAAQTGEDKARLGRAAKPFVFEPEKERIIYAHWEEQESYGRRVRITYYRYMMIFQDQILRVFPLYVDKKTRELRVGQPTVFTPDNLGKITVKTKEKDGALQRLELWFGDKQGKKLLQVYVDAENLRKSRWYPFNLLQQEECMAFDRFIRELAQCVAAQNPGVDALIQENDNAGNGIFGACISVMGAVFSIFLPPLGLVLALIGLIMTIVSKRKGAKGKAPLIISIICIIWSVGILGMILMYYF